MALTRSSDCRSVTESQMQHAAVLDHMIRGERSRERVALIVGNRWFLLSNELEGLAGIGAFEVSDEQVRAVLEYVHEYKVGGSDTECAPIGLWHSHLNTVEPSSWDLEHLPAWCAYGLIFQVPSQTTTRYNSAQRGVHIGIKASSNVALVDSKEQ